MTISKFIIAFACWLSLQIFTACSNNGENITPDAPEFFNPEVVSMIKADYNTVKTQGWGNLVIPRSAYSNTPPLQMSPNAKAVADRLYEAGFKVHLVGGTLRDYAMSTTPADFDFVTDATYEQCDSLFKPDFSLHQAGDAYFGGVHMPNGLIDLVHYADVPQSYIGKVKMPAGLQNSLMSDSFERDMPFNSLYFDPFTEEIVDYHGGLYSVYTKTVSAMVSPAVVQMRQRKS